MEESVTLYPGVGFDRGPYVGTYLGLKRVEAITFYDQETGKVVMKVGQISPPKDKILTHYGNPDLDRVVELPVELKKLKKGAEVDLTSKVAFWIPRMSWTDKTIKKCALYVPMVPEITVTEAYRATIEFGLGAYDNVAYELRVAGKYVAILWTTDNDRQTARNRLNAALGELSDRYEIYSGKHASKIDVDDIDKVLEMAEEVKGLVEQLKVWEAEGDIPIHQEERADKEVA